MYRFLGKCLSCGYLSGWCGVRRVFFVRGEEGLVGRGRGLLRFVGVSEFVSTRSIAFLNEVSRVFRGEFDGEGRDFFYRVVGMLGRFYAKLEVVEVKS